MTLIDLGAARSHLKLPATIRTAITAASAEPLSFTTPNAQLFAAVADWMQRRHDWHAPVADAIFLPKTTHLVSALLNAGPTCYDPPENEGGVMGAMMDPATAMQMGAPLEMVGQLAQQQQRTRSEVEHGPERPPIVVALSPTYGRVAQMVRASGAQLRLVRMQNFGGRLRINWPALENAMIGADYLLWTNPHNPTGRAWSVEELQRVGYLAEIYRTTVLSDDIHADYATGSYTPLAKACPGLYARGLLAQVHSPTITFPMSGMHTAVVFATGQLATDLAHAKQRLSLTDANPLAIAAATAAWQSGDAAADDQQQLVTANRARTADYLRAALPDCEVTEAEGTCMMWADFKADGATIAKRARDEGVIVSAGGGFGETWSTYLRLTVALPEAELSEGLSRLVAAITSAA